MGYLKPRATALQQALEEPDLPATHTKALLTVGEAISVLRISKWTLYGYIQRNELPSVKLGKRRLFRESDLLAFIEQHKVEALA